MTKAMETGEFRILDPETAAYCLMGMGDFLGMLHIRWEGRNRVPQNVIDTAMEITLHGLLAPSR
jgi:hypothetical protein